MARHGMISDAAPPLLLALETTGMCGSVALVGEESCVAEFSLATRATHSRRLLHGVEWLFEQARCDWSQIHGIAVSLGPGSFTGLRIGLSTAKGLAMAAELPLIGVPTLDAFASRFAHLARPLCVLLDARKGEVYAAFYRCDAAGVVRREGDFLVLPPEVLAARLTEPTVLVGDGVALYGERLRELAGDRALLLASSCLFASAATVGMLAWPLLHRHGSADPAAVVPIYVRASDAELNFIPPSQPLPA